MTDALDRSLLLAAAMDSRGYGRTADVPRRVRAAQRARCSSAGWSASASAPTACSTAPRRAALGLPMLLRRRGRRVGRARPQRPARVAQPLPARPVAARRSGPSPASALLVAAVVITRERRRPRRPLPVAAAAAVADAARGARRGRPRSARCRPGSPRPRGVAAAPVARPVARARRGAAPRDPLRARHDHLRRRARARRCATSTSPSPEGELCVVVGRDRVGQDDLARRHQRPVPHFTGGHLAGRVVVDGRDTRTHPPRELADVVGHGRAGPAGRVRHRHRGGGARLRDGAAGRARRRHAQARRGDARPARHRRAARPRRCARSRAASSSASPSARCSPPTRGSSCSTSRPRRSTPPRPRRCWPPSPGSCTTSASRW